MAVLRRASFAVVLFVLAGCASHPAIVVDRMFFGTDIPSGGHVTDDDWRSFVREVVTPHFKDGLTIFEGNGQWLDPRGEIAREHVMVIEVAHPASAAVDAEIRAIADEYKKRFKQDAVLRVTVPATMTFY